MTLLYPSLPHPPTSENLVTFQVHITLDPRALHYLEIFLQASVSLFWLSWRWQQVRYLLLSSRQWVRLPSCLWACMQPINDWKGHRVISGRCYAIILSTPTSVLSSERWNCLRMGEDEAASIYHVNCASKKSKLLLIFLTNTMYNYWPTIFINY